MIKILDYKDKNEYQEFIDICVQSIESMREKHLLQDKMILDIKLIVNKYRNKGSHTEFLNKQHLVEVKEILMAQNGLYHRVAQIKKYVNEYSKSKFN